MYFLTNLRVHPINFIFLKKGSFSLKYLDKGWFEVIGPQGLRVKLREVSFSIQKSQSLFIAGYFIFSFFLFFLFLILI